MSGEAAVSQAADRYLARRLSYRSHRGIDAAFLRVSGRLVVVAILKTFLFAWLVWLPIAAVISGIIALLLTQRAASGSGGFGGAAGDMIGGAALTGIILVILYTVLLVRFARIRERTYAADWVMSIANSADRVDAAFGSIEAAIVEARLPVQVDSRVVSAGAGVGGRYLILTAGAYQAYVGVRPFGTGLNVSWSMWLSRSRFRVVTAYLRERLAALMGRGSEFHQMLRTDPARAFREAVHNAVRVGVDVAARPDPLQGWSEDQAPSK